MRIAFLLPSLDKKGPIIFTKYLIYSIKNQVEFIKVFYFNETPVTLKMGVPCQKIKFREKIDFNNFDIIHSTMLLPDLYLYYHRNRMENKSVVSMHNFIKEDLEMNYSPWRAKIYFIIWTFILSRNIPVIVSSKQMENYYIKILSKKNTFRIIPYGINTKDYKNIAPVDEQILKELKEKYTVIGAVGLTIKRKGFDQLIFFLKSNPHHAVVIIGDGEEKERLNQLASNSGVSDRFKILGFRTDSYNYYQYIDIYALTSYSEGFGLAMLEAMSHAKPLVCSELPIYSDYMPSDKVGFFIPGNINSLTDAIIRVTDSLDDYSQYSLEIYRNNFTIEEMGIKHLDFYSKLISQSNN